MKEVKTFDAIYGMCKEARLCIDGCGLCKFIDPNQTPDYKATNQAQRYRRHQNAGKLKLPDVESITIGYKDPLVELEDGYGYYGTIAVDKLTETCVRCHRCGFYFKWLGQHIKEHDMTPEDYKRQYGLAIGKSLLSRRSKYEWQSKHSHNYTPKHREQIEKARVLALEGQKISTKIGKDSLPLEWYNKFGLCPVQIIDKYLKLEKQLGKSPSIREYANKYTWGAAHLLRKQFGSWADVKYELSGVEIVKDRISWSGVESSWLDKAKESQDRLLKRAMPPIPL